MIPLPKWWLEAKCRGMGCTLFFPPSETETPPARRRREAAAKIICRDCTVKTECLREALATGDEGIRGGTTPAERRRLTAPIPEQRIVHNDPNWRIVVNRPGIINSGIVRLEQNVDNPEHYRVMRDEKFISEHRSELEAWIALHKAT